MSAQVQKHREPRVKSSGPLPPSDDVMEDSLEQVVEEEVDENVRVRPPSAARADHVIEAASLEKDGMHLENDVPVNRQGTTAAGIFQKMLPNLTTPLGREPNFTTVTDLLFGEGLITKLVLDGITSQPNLTDKQRGSKVAHVLLDKIKASDDPVQCLLKICTVLEDDLVDDDKLKKYGDDMRKQLYLQAHIRKDSRRPQQQLVVPMEEAAVKSSDNNQTRFINALESMIQRDRELTAIAEDLKANFSDLEIGVKNCLKSKPSLFQDAKRLVRRELSDSCACRREVMQQYQYELDRINDEEELFNFLCDHRFVSYLNYRLLERISSIVADRKIRRKFETYNRDYTNLLKCASFDKIILVFERVHGLKPAAVIGFPLLKLRLERKELYDSLYDCLESVKIPPSISHNITNVETSCIIITFCVFPTALLDLLNYLNDPANVKRLQTNEASITLELPDTDINETCQVLIEQITANDELSSVINILWTNDSSIVAIEAAPTSQVLQRFSDRLSQLALPMELVQLLYTEGVISMERLHDVDTRWSSLKELCTTVKPAVLRVLGTVLLKSEVSVPLANDILRYSDGDSQQSDSVTQFFLYSKSTEGVSSDIDSGDTEAQSLQELYSSLISSVRPFIADFVVRVLKFLSRVYQEMSPQLAHAETTDDVLQLIEENCSIENIYCLETVIDHYDIKAAKVPLEEYKEEVNELFEQISIGDCLNVSFRLSSSPYLLLKCDTVEFHLSLQFLQRPLKEIRVLLSKLFNGFANRVLMESIHQMEESIVVKCSAPHLLMDVLQLEVSKSELTVKGLLSLTVGYSVLLERQESSVRFVEKEVTQDVEILREQMADLQERLRQSSVTEGEIRSQLEVEQRKSHAASSEAQQWRSAFESKEKEFQNYKNKIETADEERERERSERVQEISKLRHEQEEKQQVIESLTQKLDKQDSKLRETIFSSVRQLADKIEEQLLGLYTLALQGLNIKELDKHKAFTEQFNLLQNVLKPLPLAVAFTCYVLKKFGCGHVSSLEQYASPDFNIAAYPEVDLRLTVAAFLYDLNRSRERPNALTFISSVYMSKFNYRSVTVPEFVQIMCERGVIKVGSISALDSLVRQYRPSFFKDYHKRFSQRPPVTPQPRSTEPPTLAGPISSPEQETTDQGVLSQQVPTLSELMKALKPIKGRWESLSYVLDVDRPARPSADSLTNLSTVLNTWISKGSDVTWKRLIDALETLDEQDLSREIRKNYSDII